MLGLWNFAGRERSCEPVRDGNDPFIVFLVWIAGSVFVYLGTYLLVNWAAVALNVISDFASKNLAMKRTHVSNESEEVETRVAIAMMVLAAWTFFFRA